jgi:hypothetical protein
MEWIHSTLIVHYAGDLIAQGSWGTITDRSSMKRGGIIVISRFPGFYLCRRKGKLSKINHKTFSLLHYHLIPYSLYSLSFVVKVLRSRCIDGMTVERIQGCPGDITTTGDNYKELSASGIFAFKGLLVKAVTKILISGYYPRLSNELAGTSQETVRIKTFLAFSLDFICQKYIPPIRGPCALSYDFYITGGSYLRNAFFLFGTPSQFRPINNKIQRPA